MTSKELLGHLEDMKIPAKTPSSALEDAYVSMVRKKLAPVLEARAAEIEAAKRAEEEATAAEEAARAAAAEAERIEAERRQRRHQLLAGERLMNGIPRSGMGQTKVEDFAGRQTGAAAPQGDPRIGKFTQRVPGIGTVHTEAPCGRTDSSG